MDLDDIRQILEMMREHELAEFELERDNVKLRLRKSGSPAWNESMPISAGVCRFHPGSVNRGGT